jgi:hypothetical protein
MRCSNTTAVEYRRVGGASPTDTGTGEDVSFCARFSNMHLQLLPGGSIAEWPKDAHTFSTCLFPSGRILFHYKNITDAAATADARYDWIVGVRDDASHANTNTPRSNPNSAAAAVDADDAARVQAANLTSQWLPSSGR